MKKVKIDQLGTAIAEELTLYHESVRDAVNAAGEAAIKDLVTKTKATAPVDSGDFKKHITSTTQDTGLGSKRFIWHVRAPKHRLTHLIVHGHATKTGGRTKGNPFLQNALDQVLPEYEKAVEDAIKNA